jgi:ribA/ribD-fused uncharacterized protein
MITFYRNTDPYGIFSNHHPAPFILDAVEWRTIEHYYQAQKFPNHPEQREQIRLTPHPMEAKRLAYTYKQGFRSDWESARDAVMLEATRALYAQNADLRSALLATGSEPLGEASPTDYYWGLGADGTGRNRFGEILMQVRDGCAASARPSVNRVILDWLFDSGRIDLRRSDLFDAAPAAPLQPVAWSRVEGMCLGLAIGDSLGNSNERLSPMERRAAYGEVVDYLPNRHARQRRVGLPTDDTQMAFWALDQVNRDGTLVTDSIARRFSTQEIYGIGFAVRDFITRFKDQDMPWWDASMLSAGNGALMRIAPVLIPHLRRPSPELWTDTALSAMVTHNDTFSLASCVAFTAMLWDLLAMDGPPEPRWWLDRFLEVATPLDTGRLYETRSPHLPQRALTFSEWLPDLLEPALRDSPTTLDACERWYSAAYLLETVPSAFYILMRHAHDPEQAILRAVNDTRDNDTTAAIVGAAVGALHGTDALPHRWRKGLLGRLGSDDDGALFRLLDESKRLWYPS